MSTRRPPPPLPGWLVRVGSLAVAGHLFALGALVLAAPSGPWPSPFGASVAIGPTFAGQIEQVTTRYYLQPLRMTHNYHFLSNRPDTTAALFEARVKDDRGNEIATVRVPAAGDSPWVRARHTLLAQGLANDEPVQAPRGEVIPAPGRRMAKVTLWDAPPGGGPQVLREVDLHLVPKDRPVSRPADWALLLARSYQRHLARRYGGATVELSRHSRSPVVPALLFLDEPPPGTFDTLVSQFGEYRREN